MNIVLVILKVLGMAFVILSCVAFIQRMVMVATMTGQWAYPVGMGLISCLMIYWAYCVIWRPIKRKARME